MIGRRYTCKEWTERRGEKWRGREREREKEKERNTRKRSQLIQYKYSASKIATYNRDKKPATCTSI